MMLTAVQRDRAAGVLLATAAGDALGAPFEFGPPQPPSVPVEMTGGGMWERGEWTDDTAMAVAIAEVAADGIDLRAEAAQDRVVGRWYGWSRGAKDVGIQTRAVLAEAGATGGAAQARSAAETVHRRGGRSGGNGSLMRTAPVALAHLDDTTGLVDAATALSTLTHFDPEAAEACVLWCLPSGTACSPTPTPRPASAPTRRHGPPSAYRSRWCARRRPRRCAGWSPPATSTARRWSHAAPAPASRAGPTPSTGAS